MRKLPERYAEFDRLKSEGNFEKRSGVDSFRSAPSKLWDNFILDGGRRNIAANTAQYGEDGREQSLKIMVDAIAGYLVKEMEKRNQVLS